MKNNVIGFMFRLSAAILYLENMKLEYIQNIDKEHEVFKNFNQKFNFYYLNEILIIPEISIDKCKECILYIENLEIQCKGSYILFFHCNLINQNIRAESLTLPEFKYLRDCFNEKSR